MHKCHRTRPGDCGSYREVGKMMQTLAIRRWHISSVWRHLWLYSYGAWSLHGGTFLQCVGCMFVMCVCVCSGVEVFATCGDSCSHILLEEPTWSALSVANDRPVPLFQFNFSCPGILMSHVSWTACLGTKGYLHQWALASVYMNQGSIASVYMTQGSILSIWQWAVCTRGVSLLGSWQVLKFRMHAIPDVHI